MKILLIGLFIFGVLGCESKTTHGASEDSVGSVEKLQPQVSDKSLQPPKPPSIVLD